MAVEGQSQLVQVVALLAGGVIAVPLFRRLGLGSILGYLAAGVAIGPYGLGLLNDPQSILHVAELGVIMFLFIIGLEMQPSRLWNLRRQIFGLGAALVIGCGLLLTGVGMLAGLSAPVAFVGAMGFVLTSTAVAMQLLDERGETSTPGGQRVVSILLLEDLAIVPLLAIVAVLAPGAEASGSSRWMQLGVAALSLGLLLAAGRWLLNPLFRLLAASGAREVMTAAALLVVLGAALGMQLGGLSMAMGAFVAGVLLSESVFRHQLEADIEPFRGILLGLFFMAVGMSLDFSVLASDWVRIFLGVIAFMAVKAAGIYLIARLFHAPHRDALLRAAIMAQGGEFAFVLYSSALAAGIFDASTSAALTAVVILSMALTPFVVFALRWLTPAEIQSTDGVEAADGLSGSVLVVGFGRFAQVASQALLARGVDVAIIETDVEMIQSASRFGFKVYYGDGSRLDVLRASGAEHARAIMVCVDKQETADRIVELVKAEFPLTKLFVRAYDRGHALSLIEAGVDFQIRETFESAMVFGERALVELGVPEEEAAEIAADVRARDAERLALQMTGGIEAGSSLVFGNAGTGRQPAPTPTPLTQPKKPGRALNEDAAKAIATEETREPASPPP